MNYQLWIILKINNTIKRKVITLENGNEDKWYWAIVSYIYPNGTFGAKGDFQFNEHEERKIACKKWRDNHIEDVHEKDNERYLMRKNEVKKRAQYWNRNHKKERKWITKKYYITHRNELLDDKKRYQQSERGKEVAKRVRNKRKRNLRFIPINKPIEGIECDAHHINSEEIIYLPSIIHRRIFHNFEIGKNIDLINSIAYGFI